MLITIKVYFFGRAKNFFKYYYVALFVSNYFLSPYFLINVLYLFLFFGSVAPRALGALGSQIPLELEHGSLDRGAVLVRLQSTD